jgi:hypothetical protein
MPSKEVIMPESHRETQIDALTPVKNSYNLSSDPLIFLLFSFMFRVLRYEAGAGGRFKTSFRHFSASVEHVFMPHARSNSEVAIFTITSLEKGVLKDA